MITAVLTLLLLHQQVPAQPDTLPSAADSAGLADTQPDTLRRIPVPPWSGTPDVHRDSALILTRDARYFRPYRSPGGAFAELPGVWIADQTSEGQYSAFRPRGADGRAVVLLRDGLSAGDPATGAANIWHVPAEEGEVLELVTGPRAMLYGAPGAALNVITPMDNSNVPVSRITYAESGYEFTRTDGSFAQNVSRRVNIAGGFQALGTDGRFSNSPHEQWNARGRIRYALTEHLHGAVSYTFLHTQTGLYGGVSPALAGSASAYDPLRAAVISTDAYEKITRNDAEIRLFGSVTGDSAARATLSLYYARQVREYRDEENRRGANGLLVQDDHTTSLLGGAVRNAWTAGAFTVRAGGSFELRQVEGSPAMGRRRNTAGNAWGLVELPIAGGITGAVFARTEAFRGTTSPGYGADLRAVALPGLTLACGVSSSPRFATYQELFWTSPDVGREALPAVERHLQAEVRAEYRTDGVAARVAAFTRRVTDPILVTPGDTARVFPSLIFTGGTPQATRGIETAAHMRFWMVEFDAAALVLEHPDLPGLSGSAGVYFRGRLIGEALDLKAGVRGRYQSAHRGLRFNPEVLVSVPHGGPDLPAAGWVDFQLFARIGDAHVHLLWENVGDVRAMASPYYPIGGRQVSFGIAWEFLN